MEVNLICDCQDCYSVLIQVGCVNVLCDIPFKLLHDFSESINESVNCNFNSNCELYEKLNCTKIHVVLITNSRGFQGLNLLNDFFDLSFTHIVCTRPVYVLSTIYYLNNSDSSRRTEDDRLGRFTGFGVSRLISNLRETRYKNECNLLHFLNNDLLHLLSYNEPLSLSVTTRNNYPNNGPSVNGWTLDCLNDFSVTLNVTAMSNGYCLGSCNYLITHGNIRERIVFISKSSTRKRYTKSFDYSIFDNTGPNDVIIVADTTGSNGNGSTDANSSAANGTSKGAGTNSKRNSSAAKGAKNAKSEVKRERKELDEHEPSLFDTTSADIKAESDESEGALGELGNLSVFCINNVLRGHNVFIPVDFNYEYLVDLFESLGRTIRSMKKQVYLYCVGAGVEDLLDYIDKCCDWVSAERSELTMHAEDPRSPFPDLEEMKLNNQFFYSDSLNGINSLFREPSIVVMVIRQRADFLGYLQNPNNRFVILQSKFYPFETSPVSVITLINTELAAASIPDDEALNSGRPMDNSPFASGVLINTNSISRSSTIKATSLSERCVCTYVDLTTSLTNINVSCRLVPLNGANRHHKLYLDEANVGYLRVAVPTAMVDSLDFSRLDIATTAPKTESSGRASRTARLNPGTNGHCANPHLEFNKFKVDFTDEYSLVLSQWNDDDRQSISDTASEVTPPQSPIKPKSKSQPKDETPVPEIPDEVNDVFSFGACDPNKLIAELRKYFPDAVKLSKASNALTLTSSAFKIVLSNDCTRTTIETTSDAYRKCILKSLQDVLVSI